MSKIEVWIRGQKGPRSGHAGAGYNWGAIGGAPRRNRGRWAPVSRPGGAWRKEGMRRRVAGLARTIGEILGVRLLAEALAELPLVLGRHGAR